MDFDDDEVFKASGDEDKTLNHSDQDDHGLAMKPTSNTNVDDDVDKFEYWVLAPDEIMQEMSTMIKDVAAVLQIQLTTCRILLRHFKWDKENLLERFYDTSDPEKFFREAQVVSPFVHQAKPREHLDNPRVVHCATEETCLICCFSFSTSSLTGLECEHRFCVVCWRTYLTTKVMEEVRGQSITCPEHKCDVLVDDAKVMEVIYDWKVLRRYQHLITNSFVECNRLFKWCPGTDCGRAVKVQYSDVRPVTCHCGITFCFACRHEWHEPMTCRLLKQWLRKCCDDSETMNWISANTKKCPKCHVAIEKNGYCNQMTCTACKMKFCWMCLGPWESHGSLWDLCNRIDNLAAKEARDAEERSRAALQRYLRYYDRYLNHQQSLRLENNLYEIVKTKMEQMQQQNMSWSEVQFLKKAVDILCQCRRTLMYTYSFAFYLKKNSQSEIFEDNQHDLEHATKLLSEFLERDFESENAVSFGQKVQDMYRYVEKRRLVLLKHCSEGTEKNWWDYTS